MFNKRPPSGLDEKDLTPSSAHLTEKKDSFIVPAKILRRYFSICDSNLIDDFSDSQYLNDHRSDIAIGSSEEKNCLNDTTEALGKFLMNKDLVLPDYEVALKLPEYNRVTNYDQSENDQEPQISNKEQEYNIVISVDIANIWNVLLDRNDKSPEEYTIHFLK